MNAAEAAFDAVADAEQRHRDRSQGSPSSSDPSTSTSGVAVAAVAAVAPADGAEQPAFAATESVMQQRTYFGGVMVAYVAGLGVAFAVRLGLQCMTFTDVLCTVDISCYVFSAAQTRIGDCCWAQANAITHMGQPALLYLVPLTLGSVALTAASRGDIQRVLQYKDASTEKPAEESGVSR